MGERIGAVVTAAGLSSRMGAFKPLLPLAGATVIEHTVASLLRGGAGQVTVVTGYRADQVEAALHRTFDERVRCVRNENYAASDMMASVRIGVSALAPCDAFFLLPGDMPAVGEATFAALRQARDEKRAAVVFPALEGRRKHPPLIDSRLIPEILAFDGQGGLRELWSWHEGALVTVAVTDKGVALDLDTPADYEACQRMFHISTGQKEVGSDMDKISQSVVKKDHVPKVSGRSVYVGDYTAARDGRPILTGKILHAKVAHAKVLGVDVPELPEGYFYVDARDVPGDNNVNIVLDDTPVYCRETVEYIGEPIAMICGPDPKVVERLVKECHVRYEELTPVLDLRTADEAFFDYHFGHGDVDQAFAQADKVYDEEFETGYQDQTYLETQGMMAEPEADGKMFVHGSLQCAYYVHGAVSRVLGCGPEGVHILQDVTGGGFGGKEAFPSILGSQVAVAAFKCKAPVRCVFDRREDLEYTSKRHPSLCRYRVAVKNGKVTAMDIDVKFNAGAYSTLSAVVLQRGIIASPGVYNVPNLRVHGWAVKTNTSPCGAYRGFGAPQTFFAVEMMMDHIARDLGVDSLAFKLAHLVKQGDPTSTCGKYHFPVPVRDMVEEVNAASDYRTKRALYDKPQTGRYRRGIGMSLYFHGAGFTGSGERDLIKAVAKLRKYADGTVEILASNGEIGQGLRTTFPKIVANELGLPLEKVFYDHPDTARVPDSGPTVASRSLMVVGELLRRAAIKLREQWQDGVEQEVEERFHQPDYQIPFSLEEFRGDAYPTYSWAVNAIEVEVDTYTGISRILGAYGSFDVGTPMDYNIVMGQMEGGFLQGIGYASIEKMDYDDKGRIRNNSFSDYLIPTTKDVPNLKCMLHVEKFPDGPYGAKGAGELPLVGAPGAYVEAVEQALGRSVSLHHAPFTAEDTMKIIMKEGI